MKKKQINPLQKNKGRKKFYLYLNQHQEDLLNHFDVVMLNELANV